MIEVSKKWCTTPVVCNVCTKRTQLVFESEIIRDNDQELWKLPTDLVCNQCGSTDHTFTHFHEKGV